MVTSFLSSPFCLFPLSFLNTFLVTYRSKQNILASISSECYTQYGTWGLLFTVDASRSWWLGIRVAACYIIHHTPALAKHDCDMSTGNVALWQYRRLTSNCIRRDQLIALRFLHLAIKVCRFWWERRRLDCACSDFGIKCGIVNKAAARGPFLRQSCGSESFIQFLALVDIDSLHT